MLRTFSVGYFADAQYDVKSPIGTSCLAMTVKIKKENGGRFPFFDCILIYYSVLSVLLLPKNVPQPLVLGRG